MSYACSLLARQMYSEKKLSEKIECKFDTLDVEAKITIEKVLVRLKEISLINDLEFARIITRNCMAYNNLGKAGIRKKLMIKKIPLQIVVQVLEEVPFEEYDRAIIFLKKKWSCLQGVEGKTKKKQKIARLLANRGFSSSTTIDVLQKYDDIATMIAQ